MTAPAPRPDDRPSFDAEIRGALRYERVLAARALIVIAVVVAVLALRVYFFG
jgi:hypothetical protein